MQWNDGYLIGVEELDYEHRDLFNRLNNLHQELLGQNDKENIEACLGEIHTRIMSHFALEERFMREAMTPTYEQHKREHDDFLEVIVDIIEQFRTDPDLSYGNTLEKQLRRWIVSHITTSDREMIDLNPGAN